MTFEELHASLHQQIGEQGAHLHAVEAVLCEDHYTVMVYGYFNLHCDWPDFARCYDPDPGEQFDRDDIEKRLRSPQLLRVLH